MNEKQNNKILLWVGNLLFKRYESYLFPKQKNLQIYFRLLNPKINEIELSTLFQYLPEEAENSKLFASTKLILSYKKQCYFIESHSTNISENIPQSFLYKFYKLTSPIQNKLKKYLKELNTLSNTPTKLLDISKQEITYYFDGNYESKFIPICGATL